MTKDNALILRDMSRGVYRSSSANTAVLPPNSVSHALNVNFDQIIGSGVVRAGTTLLGATVASNKTPLGLAEFVTTGGASYALSVFSGASTATIYYYDTAWHASTVTNLSNTAVNRFATLGGRVFRVNGVDAMTSSADGNTWATTDCITTIIPSVVIRSSNRLLVSGYSSFKSRVYFSSVIDPNASPYITWNIDPTNGDWIDVNPDDNSNVTGFALTSTLTLVFKTQGMYRLNTISKQIDADNIFNIGAISQEGIVNCQGIVYFFSGLDIRRTDGSYPEQISRLGVQDFIDAIPPSSWSAVSASTDGLNVYFSIGSVTLRTGQNTQKTYSNVVLKFSPRDQNWSIHSYGNLFKQFCNLTTTAGRTLIGSTTAGDVQTLNSGTTDNTTPIYYELETQELEGTNRAHLKTLADNIVVYCQNGKDSTIQVKNESSDYKDVPITLSGRVNKSEQINIQGRFFTFRWYGETSGTPPIFEGLYVENVTDEGIT